MISPDRDSATDTSVKKVGKFKDQLTNSVGMNASLDGAEIRKMVAVRRGDKFVRGKVQEIFSNTSRVVRVLMTDWGEIV